VDLILGFGLCICQYSLVNRSWVAHDGCDVFSDVANIRERRRVVAARDDVVVRECQAFIELAGRDSGQGDLVPPTYINYSVRKIDSLDVIKDFLLLQQTLALWIHEKGSTHSIANIHYTARGNGSEEAWHISLHASLLSCVGQWNLITK
jgi:hypothetical protein